MHVIGHHHKFIRIQLNFPAHFRRTEPFLTHTDAVLIEPHFPLHHLAKQVRPCCVQMVTKYASARV